MKPWASTPVQEKQTKTNTTSFTSLLSLPQCSERVPGHGQREPHLWVFNDTHPVFDFSDLFKTCFFNCPNLCAYPVSIDAIWWMIMAPYLIPNTGLMGSFRMTLIGDEPGLLKLFYIAPVLSSIAYLFIQHLYVCSTMLASCKCLVEDWVEQIKSVCEFRAVNPFFLIYNKNFKKIFITA